MRRLDGGADLGQSNRLGALSKFRAKSRNIFVATDVAARGLDIPNIDCVINFDLPDDSTTYIHRVGRTARAGKAGRAISLVTQYDAEVWLRIEHALQCKIPELPVQKEEVMLMLDRVYEAQAMAKQRMRETEKGANPRKRKAFGAKVKAASMRDNE